MDRALLKGIYTNNRIELENPPIVFNPEKKPEKARRNKFHASVESSIEVSSDASDALDKRLVPDVASDKLAPSGLATDRPLEKVIEQDKVQ